MRQRRLDGDGGVKAGEDVGQCHADLLRTGAFFVIGASRDAHQAAHALDQEIVAGARGVGAVLAEAGDRAIHELRIERREAGVVEAIGLEPADLEVFQHHVRLRRQLAQDGLPLGAGHVHGQRTLVAVGAQEIGGIRRRLARAVGEPGRPPAARIVTALAIRAGLLDLDHVGAEVAQQLRGPRPGQDAGQVEDLQPGESAVGR